MQNVNWNTAATYNSRSTTLLDCVRAWRRDASRGTGAIGSIRTTEPVALDGWRSPASDLSLRQCWDLVQIAPKAR